VENAPADAQVVALLEQRFAQHLADPEGRAGTVEEVFARLAERKRQWK